MYSWQSVIELVRRTLFALHEEEGQDLVEYGILAAFISPLVIFTVVLIGPELQRFFQDVVNAFPS